MKKIITVTIILLLLSMTLSGCAVLSEKAVGQSMQVKAGKGGIKIYTSFYPMYFLTSEIAGDKAEIVLMVPAGAEPHDWEPTPKTVIELNKADMFVYNGAGMEVWVDKILSGINKDKTKIVNASSGIELLEALEHGEEHEHEEHEHDHGRYDPHIWVSPLRAMQQTKTIYEALVEIDSSNSEYYECNFKELTAKLTKLDKDIRDACQSFKSNVIVVSHEAFGYFAKDYNLKQVAIRGINPQEEPSPSKMAELVRECRENEVKCVFFEKLTSPKLSETLAKEVGAGTLVLNTAAGLIEEDLKSGKDYVTVMYENLENLKKALGD